MERYDLVIIGGGAAGINALNTAVTLAARVVLVEPPAFVMKGDGRVGLDEADSLVAQRGDEALLGDRVVDRRPVVLFRRGSTLERRSSG